MKDDVIKLAVIVVLISACFLFVACSRIGDEPEQLNHSGNVIGPVALDSCNVWKDTSGRANRPGAVGVNQYTSFPWGFNLPFRGCWTMTCGYGCGFHTGTELYATDWANGTCTSEVLAPGAGWVLFAGWLPQYGNTVLIECGPTGLPNGSRYIVRLSHLSRIDVVAGWWLPLGWRVGLVGMTGNASGCHIHWTVYRGFYAGYGRVNGWSFPPSFSTGVDGFNGNGGRWCSQF